MVRDVKRVTVVLAVVVFLVASQVTRADEFDRVMEITFKRSGGSPGQYWRRVFMSSGSPTQRVIAMSWRCGAMMGQRSIRRC